ncbi:hypothetical protein E6C70_09275 [Glaciibacter flavus]|uniref:Uncharacterized protein n=1 Tax=Orlajensenia flava TaxID=2565934 RepID=A0A4S4FUQ6_9MICO|nr:hypothetical protein E6C70_09275 [Glaciibacter flavus]
MVCHDESPHNTVLGVFATQEEAAAVAEEVGPRFENGAIYFGWQIGQRYYEGTRFLIYRPTD